jgi:hypothetical protein
MSARPRGMLPHDWLVQCGWTMIPDGALFAWQCQWIDPLTGNEMLFHAAKELQERRDKEA